MLRARTVTHTQQDFQDMDAIAKLEATTNASSEKFIETNKVATHICVHQLFQKIHFLSHFAVALKSLAELDICKSLIVFLYARNIYAHMSASIFYVIIFFVIDR